MEQIAVLSLIVDVAVFLFGDGVVTRAWKKRAKTEETKPGRTGRWGFAVLAALMLFAIIVDGAERAAQTAQEAAQTDYLSYDEYVAARFQINDSDGGSGKSTEDAVRIYTG